ncbi:DUF547 domain-containing protein [Pseudomonas sp. sp1636]|uniref:DUF547 domain-containing protein n=1 Tax=Pseudomonas sp. sp1636 TaxID=3036707 RepID=UPI0025A658C4|nr:DUF547 domain-containing protein [Pseudomonas sp. sp1636]MDM8349478.1 DUF547 domain-containing protein [Pseudomonas sp. sp1636]
MRALLLLVMLGLSGLSFAKPFEHNHPQWTALLARHVTWVKPGYASQVDYQGFQQDQAELDSYLAVLSNVPRQQYDTWSRDQRLAFLINAYNAFTVKLVTEHYPLDSIKDIGGVFGSPWTQAFIPLFGQTLTLNQIEHSMIREPGVFDEPRIHFAVNCASIGCPALRPDAFVASTIDAQLQDSQRRFLSDRSRNRFDAAGGHFRVSKIFDWYADDFTKQSGSLQTYLQKQATLLAAAEEQAQAQSTSKVKFLDYNWSLNQAH